MSELLAAAAAALGTPEALVRRSAEARASASGMSVDEVLAEWAGGGSAAASTPAPAPAPAASEEEAATEAESAPPSVGETPTDAPATQGDILPTAAAPTAPPPTGPAMSGKPPVLVGEPDRPMTVLTGVVGLFVAMLLVGLVGPSIATENPGARTSAISYSEAALQGQDIYLNSGCGSCHTQMVRPIVSDVGLGAVTLNDSNQVIGTRRFGPDLSDVGSRLSGSQIEAIIIGFDGHPGSVLSSDDLDDLVTYLVESTTTALGQQDQAPDEGDEEAPGENADAGGQP